MRAGRPALLKENAMLPRRSSGPRGRALMLSAALLSLTGCATTTPSAATRGACGAFRPISWADADTDPTIRQVKAHNAVGQALCGWRGPSG